MRVRLRPICGRNVRLFYDQGQLVSCTGNSIADAFHFEQIKQMIANIARPIQRAARVRPGSPRSLPRVSSRQRYPLSMFCDLWQAVWHGKQRRTKTRNQEAQEETGAEASRNASSIACGEQSARSKAIITSLGSTAARLSNPRLSPYRVRFLGKCASLYPLLATLLDPWLDNASASISWKAWTGANKSRGPSAFRRIPRRLCRVTISTVGLNSAQATGK